MKSSNNGMVDPVTKTVRLPGYLGKPHPRAEWLRMAAVAALPWAVWFTSPSSIQAQTTPVTLTSTDGYTVAVVDPVPQTAGANAGLNSLTIANPAVPQVNNQWFYYRLGTTDSGAFSALQNLGTPVEFQAIPNVADLTYSGTYNGNVPFTIGVQYTLTGQGKTGATLGETITISDNSSTTALPIDFIQYNNFTLAGDTTHEDITGISPMDIDQVNELNAASIKEHAGVTSANYYEAVTYASSPANAPDFTSASFTNLDSSDTTAGPGNVVWAFEWENDGANATATIGPNSDLILSKTIGIDVPEPASAALALGAASLFGARRPRRRANVV
jgi:hypothetical protein